MSNVYECLKMSGDFTTFVNHLEATGLNETLQESGSWTVFAPTDKAFSSLGEKEDELLENAGELTDLMQYHIVPGFFTTSDLFDHHSLITLEGQRLVIKAPASPPISEPAVTDGGTVSFVIDDQIITNGAQDFTINGASIVRANFSTDNGIVHMINHVLFPYTTNL